MFGVEKRVTEACFPDTTCRPRRTGLTPFPPQQAFVTSAPIFRQDCGTLVVVAVVVVRRHCLRALRRSEQVLGKLEWPPQQTSVGEALVVVVVVAAAVRKHRQEELTSL